MFKLKSEFDVKGLSGKTAIDFIINVTNEVYQNWWPGTHLELQVIKRFPDNIGDIVVFDEYIGKRRVKFQTIVEKYIPGKEIVWKLDKGMLMPAWMTLECKDNNEGVTITHTLKAGYTGIGKLLDPFIKLFFPAGYRKDLLEHSETEFNKLPGFLSENN